MLSKLITGPFITCYCGILLNDLFPSTPFFTESKEAGSAVGDGETKPASPSSSPPVQCTPPFVEPRSSNAGLVVDNPQLNNSHPVKASSTPSEGKPYSMAFFVLPSTDGYTHLSSSYMYLFIYLGDFCFY